MKQLSNTSGQYFLNEGTNKRIQVMNSENVSTVQVKNNLKTHFHLLCLAALSEEMVIRTKLQILFTKFDMIIRTKLQILFTSFDPFDN